MADGDSFKSLTLGPALFFGGLGYLIWNEFRAVQQSGAIDYAESHAKRTGCDCNEFLDGSLVFLSCEVTKMPRITDAPTLQSIRGLFVDTDEDQGTDMLVEVEIFQNVRHESRPAAGSRGTTTVTYRKEWTNRPVNSNYSMPSNLETVQVQASVGSVWIGDSMDPKSGYYLKREDIRQVTRVPHRELFVRQADRQGEPQEEWDTSRGGKISQHNVFTNGNTLQTYPSDENPRLGDIRAKFELIKPNVVTVMARQIRPWQAIELMQHKNYVHGTGSNQGDAVANVQQFPGGLVEHPDCTFDAHENSGGYDIDWLLDGHYTLDGFIDRMRRENSWLLWSNRLGGWAAMVMGVSYLMQSGFEFCECASMDCFGVGEYASYISGVVIATPVAMLVIGLAWLAARPLIAVFLLVVAGVMGCAVLSGKWKKSSFMREVNSAVEDAEWGASHYKQIPEQMKM